MSHIAKVACTIKSLQALEMAVGYVGCEMVDGKSYQYEGRARGHDAVKVIRAKTPIKADGYAPQEIGVVPAADGSYTLRMSPMGGGICDLVGEPTWLAGKQVLAPKLVQKYTLCQLTLTAKDLGQECEVLNPINGVERVRVTLQERVSI